LVKYMKGIFTLVFFLSVSPLNSLTQNPDQAQIYRDQPLEVHLFISEIKLDDMIRSAQSQGDSEKLKQLEEANNHLLLSTKNYEYFRTQNEALLQENWREHLNWAAPSPDTPPFDKSPLGLLEHLHLFEEGGSQMRANIMVQSRQYSESETRLHQALDESIKIMREVIRIVEQTSGMARHFTSQYRIYFEAPIDYRAESTKNKVPINLVKYNSDGSPIRNVYISILDADYEIAPTAWASKRKEVLQERYPDLSDFILKEHQGDDYEFKAKYSYTYSWEGNPIKALVLVHKRGQQANLLVCLAMADSFDRNEFERIIASYYH